ncbi:MAG: PIG-L family deacetylase, partial [Runella slithyformis]
MKKTIRFSILPFYLSPFTFLLFTLYFSLFTFNSPLQAQVKSQTASEILLNLKKLNVCGSVLHVAAHPDDENSLLLTYMAKDRLVWTGYLALTRGDGGQNLIGSEQGEYIGVIRTQELQAARRADGAEQLFARAYDFGFSKTREETLKFWGESKILGDVVYLIRKHQPDVVITRFPPDARAGHGHHNSSAYLAEEAFKLSGDATKFPEQLAYVQPWQPKRIVWNTFSPGFQNSKPADRGSFVPLEISGYNPLLGKSYTELAAESRSNHKSQGFGVPATRNVRIDYFFHKGGEPAQKDILEGIDMTWNRVKGSETVAQLIDQAIKKYNVSEPVGSVPILAKIYEELGKLDAENLYVKMKKKETEDLIISCLGLWIETNPVDYSVAVGDKIEVKISAVKRAEFPVKLTRVQFLGAKLDTTLNLDLRLNETTTLPILAQIPKTTKITQPYWLEKPIKDKVFQIDDQRKIGPPESTPELQTAYTFQIDSQFFTFTKPWIYKFTDPVDGEIYRPFEVRPEVTANVAEPVYVFADNKPKTVEVILKAQRPNASGKLTFCLPNTWKVTPEKAAFEMKDKYEEKRFTFTLTPPASNEQGHVIMMIETPSGTSTKGIRTLPHKHIPTQTIFPEAEAAVVKLSVKTTAKNIGYIAGAGDEVPASLRQMGCQVTLLDEVELNKNLAVYDAIVVGIRAYNTEDRIGFFQNKLMEYVKNGGTMVVQYATSGGFLGNGLKVKDIGPYPFKISRDRVTDEEAKMTLLQPNHPILNTPNKITEADFAGWVQERGIYFAQDWDKNYVPLFRCGDPNEAEKDGSLIYTQYGKGHFVYTGLSFFRELPAGVSGAYRLFANLISLSKK